MLLRPAHEPVTVGLRDKRAIATAVVDAIVDLRATLTPPSPISTQHSEH